jgi:hypothetical protein
MIADNFKNHQVFEKLQQLNQTLNSDEANEKIQVIDAAFFNTAYKYIVNKLKHTLPILVVETELTALANEIDAGMVQLNSYLGNNNIGHINNAINNFNSIITKVRNFPFLLSKDDFDFSKSIADFQQATHSGYESLKRINEMLGKDLETFQVDLEKNKAQITLLEIKLSEKESEIQNVLTRFNMDFDALKSSANADLNNEMKKINDSINTDREQHKEQFIKNIESNKKVFEEHKLEFEKQSLNVIAILNSKLAEARKIVNIVGNVGVTGNYQNVANENKKNADNYRKIALGFMLLMSILLIWSIIDISKTGEFNFYKSIARILAAAVLTYPAIYAARESSKHRNLETINRNIELELASIGPFIELLSEDKKEKIKEELVNKYFGNQTSVTGTKEEDDVSVNALERIFKVVLPFIKK